MKRAGVATNSWVLRLIVINIIVFIMQNYFALRLPVIEYLNRKYTYISGMFGLVPGLVIDKGYIWQLASYMFLHSTGNILHIIFNMYALLMFGVAIESVWGSKRFLIYYFFTGIGAGITILIVNGFIIGGSLWSIPTIGASGAVFGILLAFGILYPNVDILLFFFIPIKAKYFVIGYGALTLSLLIQQNPNDMVSHAGHFGGLLFGILYFIGVHFIRKKRQDVPVFQEAIKQLEKKQVVEKSNEPVEEDHARYINILTKVKQGGVDSLSDDELQKVKYLEIMYRDDSGSLCEEEDFNYQDDYCLKCENVEACIARALSKYITLDD